MFNVRVGGSLDFIQKVRWCLQEDDFTLRWKHNSRCFTKKKKKKKSALLPKILNAYWKKIPHVSLFLTLTNIHKINSLLLSHSTS